MDQRPNALVLRLESTLEAPPEQVFRMLTEPAELARWWGPAGFTTPGVELDLREAKRYRFTMQPADGDAFHLSGEFLDVEPPARLVYTFRWDEPDPDDRETVVTLSLTPEGDGTRLSLTQGEFATEARLALHRDGWSEALAKLRELLVS